MHGSWGGEATWAPSNLASWPTYLIVVKGNPLFDIMALANVEVVVKDGVVYKGRPGSGKR